MSQRSLWTAGLVPLLALLFLQLWSPSTIERATEPLYSIFGRSAVPTRTKTPIIMAVTPHFSHAEKLTTIAEGLLALGYPVSFITGPEFKDYVESIGATFIPIEGATHAMMSDEDLGKFVTLQGDEQEVFALTTLFINTIPAQHRTLQHAFNDIREKYGKDQKLVYLFDCSFSGLSPVFYGAPGIRPDVAIAVGLAPYPVASNDTYPFRSGQLPDTSPDAKRIHFEAQKLQYEHPIDKPSNAAMKEQLARMGAKSAPPSIYDMMGLSSDIYLQYGIPEFEYERSDIRPNLVFMGAPVAVGIVEQVLPEWWDDVLEARKAGKHIVAVTSSSVSFDTNALIIPALEAFKDRDDVFVIATLVTSDVDHLSINIPDNARVAKFIPLDLALPHVSVLITNGGYGTIQQALRAGVPMITSGVGQDKLSIGALINHTGVGIYHAISHVTSKILSDALDKLLTDENYYTTSRAIAKQYEKYNAIEIVDATIQQALREGGF